MPGPLRNAKKEEKDKKGVRGYVRGELLMTKKTKEADDGISMWQKDETYIHILTTKKQKKK